ncbi:undecaprenyl-diphosphate phosphatase [Patescibacteria group bacterium]|nr:undecaprenyl-diphosphate phosphatase [Patescibacteria group bacterium]MBU1970163.1 undecaprenyl-diphosphate phosphatase [Patescibacteria group bacterium]
MTLFYALILSIVEGLTEFLPVSSTAHLVLATQLLNIPQTDFVKSFEIIIQLGAILAVVVLYFNELRKDTAVWYKTILAFLPAAILGFFLYDFIKERLLGNGMVTALSLILGGVIFTIIDRFTSKNQPVVAAQVPQLNNPRYFTPNAKSTSSNISDLTPVRLLIIGLCQSLAMVPGVSRSAASIFGGLLMGLNKTAAVKFSFFLAIPTMLAATTLDLYKSQLNFSPTEITLLCFGFLGSFIAALLAIKSFLKVVQKYSFLPFGIYRIALGIFWLFVILKS